MSRINKAVILTAGLGTRLIPFSKEMPKEMLPLLVDVDGRIVLKPILQMVFEQLYEAGIREFCFVVGRNKRLVENHFTPDWNFVNFLENKGKNDLADLLLEFYKKLDESHITWINQPLPLGTGDALKKAEAFVGDESFVTCAGDNIYLGVNMVKKLLEKYSKYNGNFLTGRRVKNPERYGVIIYDDSKRLDPEVFKVKGIIEKPKIPPSNLVNTSLYIFDEEIFRMLRRVKKSPRGEIELTDAIEMLVEEGHMVYVLDVKETPWVDVGNAKGYIEALLLSVNVLKDRNLQASLKNLFVEKL
ncbi:MAG: NTP transferase domain-containing protein [Thermoproteales archaeon]|nr:NTP transferase domain-containing protein [Thermoproteales archaeon]RLE67114.1 MAG: hypothetical protein DRJ47_00960 [Thermoprotei archaeon]